MDSQYGPVVAALNNYRVNENNVVTNYLMAALRWYDLATRRIDTDSRIERIIRNEFLESSTFYRARIHEMLRKQVDKLRSIGNLKEKLGEKEKGQELREIADYVAAAADYFRRQFIPQIGVRTPEFFLTSVDGAIQGGNEHPYKRQRSAPDDPRRERFEVVGDIITPSQLKRLVIPQDHPLHILFS